MPTLVMPEPDLYVSVPRPAIKIAGREGAHPNETADPPEMCEQLKREIRWSCEWWPPD